VTAGKPDSIDDYILFELESNSIFIHIDLLDKPIEVYFIGLTDVIGRLSAKEY
jgi:hypothetical protein